jgi:hypothetical protein
MSREKQIEEMAEAIFQHCQCGLFFSEAERIADFVINQQGYRKQEWISVEDRLPEDGVWVLGYSAKSGRGGLCNCLKSYVREFGNYDDTTHWLPLPEFPKKKGE